MSQSPLSSIYESLGSTIRQMRKSKRITQLQLAESVFLSRASVVNIEKGRHHPKLHVLYHIAHALNCDIRDLLPGSKNIFTDIPSELSSQLKPEEKDRVLKLLRNAKSMKGG